MQYYIMINMSIISKIKSKLEKLQKEIKIVYPEGWNADIVECAKNLVSKTKYIQPILLFKSKQEVPPELPLSIKKIVIDEISNDDMKKYVEAIYEIRKNKGLSMAEALNLAKCPNFLASVMVALNEADAEICGIEYSTADTLRAALQIVGPNPNTPRVCSGFIMEHGSKRYIFGDSSLNIDPDAEQLAGIAKTLGYLAKDIALIKKPHIAMLSYSTNGSGKGPSVDKVRHAYEIASVDEVFTSKFKIFGEIQFDAAFDLEVMHKKVKKLGWDQSANVYVFPDINAGNISYKIVERLGKYKAIGPIILGLKKPVNDLSRGAKASDVENLSYITALQAIIK